MFQSASRGVLEKDGTETTWVDWDRIDNGPGAFRRYGIDKRRGKGWDGGGGWGRKATTPGGRGVIFMLTEGDGCDSADSHVPRGVRLVLTFPPGLPSLCQAFALLCPLLCFNIWSLFSISNTRAPAMTPLLKMPRIGKVSWVCLFFSCFRAYENQRLLPGHVCEWVFFVHVYMFSSCGFAPFVLHITANQIQQSCSRGDAQTESVVYRLQLSDTFRKDL